MAAVSSGIIASSGILRLLDSTSEAACAQVCERIGLTKTLEYGQWTRTVGGKSGSKEFLQHLLTSGNISAIHKAYDAIEAYLFVGGLVPGLAIPVNVIDACFCFALGNWFGCFLAIVSCFPIPGFKLVGKGFERVFTDIIKKIDVTQMFDFFSALGKRLEKTGTHSPRCYHLIRERISELTVGMNNPFVDDVIKMLQKHLEKMPLSEHTGLKYGKYEIGIDDLGSAVDNAGHLNFPWLFDGGVKFLN